MDWKDYETEILHHLEKQFPNEEMLPDQKLKGRFSDTLRQIDIFIKINAIGYNLTGVVECKYFNRKVNVKLVDQFIGFLGDVGAQVGVIITNQGFTKAAQNRATNDPQLIHLEIVEAETLPDWKFDNLSILVPILSDSIRVLEEIPSVESNILRYIDAITPRYMHFLGKLTTRQQMIIDYLCKSPFEFTPLELSKKTGMTEKIISLELNQLLKNGIINSQGNHFKILDSTLVIWYIIRNTPRKLGFITLKKYLDFLIKRFKYRSGKYFLQNEIPKIT